MRRTEGSTIKNLGIEKTHTVRETRDIISAAQGFQVEQMLFLEGFDGHLHIQVTPSEEPEDVQQGETLLFSLKHKQPVMPVRATLTRGNAPLKSVDLWPAWGGRAAFLDCCGRANGTRLHGTSPLHSLGFAGQNNNELFCSNEVGDPCCIRGIF